MSIAANDMATRLTFGLPDRLGKALTVSGVTSIEMADYLGVSRTTISNYTCGRTPAKKQTLRLWALRTGVPLEWIENGALTSTSPTPVGPTGIEPMTSTVEYGRLAEVLPFTRKAA